MFYTADFSPSAVLKKVVLVINANIVNIMQLMNYKMITVSKYFFECQNQCSSPEGYMEFVEHKDALFKI